MKSGRKPKSERNAQIIEMRKSGMTYKDIGAALGITKGRVCQVCRDFETRNEVKIGPRFTPVS